MLTKEYIDQVFRFGGFDNVIKKIYDLTYKWESNSGVSKFTDESLIADPREVALFINNTLAELIGRCTIIGDSPTSVVDLDAMVEDNYICFGADDNQPATRKALQLLCYSMVALLLAMGKKLANKLDQFMISQSLNGKLKEQPLFEHGPIYEADTTDFAHYFEFYYAVDRKAYFTIEVLGCEPLETSTYLLENFLMNGLGAITSTPFKVTYAAVPSTGKNDVREGLDKTLSEVYSLVVKGLHL